jgi:hypothetical protein
MTIEHMDSQVEVTHPQPSPRSGVNAMPMPTSAQGVRELKEFLRPIVNDIISEELANHLRISGGG